MPWGASPRPRSLPRAPLDSELGALPGLSMDAAGACPRWCGVSCRRGRGGGLFLPKPLLCPPAPAFTQQLSSCHSLAPLLARSRSHPTAWARGWQS